MFPLKTCLFGYPLRHGAYAFIGLELVIGVLSALQVFFLPEFNLPYPYKYIFLIDVVMSFFRIVIAAVGLYGVKNKEKFSFITCYTIAQFIVVMIDIVRMIEAVIFWYLIRVFFSIVITSQMSYALVVTASYQQEIHKIRTRARKNASEVPQNDQIV